MKFIIGCLILEIICHLSTGKFLKEVRIGTIFSEYIEINDAAITTAVAKLARSTSYNVSVHKYWITNPDIFKIKEQVCDMVKNNDVAAIIGPEVSLGNNVVQTVASLLQIPHFHLFPNYSLNINSEIPDLVHSFNIFPDTAIISKAIATLVKESRWKTFVILYEDDEGLVKMHETMNARKRNKLPIMLRKFGPGPDHRQLLKEVKNFNPFNIIIDCKPENTISILKQAQEIKLMAEYQNYILTSLDTYTLNFSELTHIRSNITTLTMLRNDSHALNAVRDWNLELSKRGNVHNIQVTRENIKLQTALIYDAVNIFISNFWRIDVIDNAEITIPTDLNCNSPEHSEYGLNMSKILRRPFAVGKLPGPLTGPIKFDNLGQRSDFELQIMELRPHGFVKTGTWNSNNPNVINLTFTTLEREKVIEMQIQEKIFRVFSRIGDPYFMLKETKKEEILKGNNRYEGYVVDLIEGIASYLNFTYVLEKVPDNEYGKYDPRMKEWNGLIRYILDGKADLAVCDLSITYERRTAVDFSLPFMTLGISILYTRSVRKPPDLFSFLQPLSLDVWLYVATSYLVVTLIIILVARLSQKDWENPHPCNFDPEELENAWNIKNCLWLTLGSIMTQGCDILPKGLFTRMVTGVWWFFTMIMIASYTANLTAFLTMERMEPTIESAEDLSKQTKIKYGAVEGGATASFFKESNFSTYHRMWVQMQSAESNVFKKSNEDGVQAVLKSKRTYAFLMESSTIEYQMERNCELIQVGSTMDSKGYGIAMPFNSPYRTRINQAILRMQEGGQLQTLKEKWWKKMHGGGKCKKVTSSDEAPELTLSHVGGVFVVLIGGVIIALVVALFEFLWNVRKMAVSRKLTPRQAFKLEWQFATNFRVRQKLLATK